MHTVLLHLLISLFTYLLFLMHTARDRDRDWEMMGFYIMLCTVHTTQGRDRDMEPLFFIVPVPFPFPVLVPYSVFEPLV